MLELIHSPAALGFRGRDMTVQVLLPDTGSAVMDLCLCYEVEGETRSLRMLPTDGFTAEESYSLYGATIPGADLVGDELFYRFASNGVTGEGYRVPLCTLPALPPFVITEFCPEMREGITYFEICNPGEEQVDLFDFELLLEIDGKLAGRNPLASAKGEHLLLGGEVAVLRYFTAKLLQQHGDEATLDAVFWQALASAFPANCEEITEHLPKCFTVTTAQKTSQGYEDTPGSFHVLQYCAYRMLVVPRGGGISDALYSIGISLDGLCLDVPVQTVALYGIDLTAPQNAVRLATKRQGTPGFPDVGQVLPNVADACVPAILALEAGESIKLAGGDLSLRFAVLGGAAGCPTVFVKNGAEYQRYPAALNTAGVYEANIPFLHLAHLGSKLQYYIEVTGACYTARLGSAEHPLTRRITDNAGPAILSHYPAEGQAVEPDGGALVRIRFFDGTGVNLRTSVLCFDGFNVSGEAKWKADGVTFTPKKPPTLGEHVVEVTLRDTLGNRTYRRTAFVITDGKELQFYRGEVHSHTVDSDARGSIEEAMVYARDVGKVDFFAVTDHCTYMEPQDMLRHKRVADSFNKNGSFAALYGYEPGWDKRGFWGHMNVLGNEWLLYAPHTPMPQLFEKLKQEEDVIAQFNHPGENWGDFDSFAGHDDEIDRRICLQEVKRMEFDDHYALSLARGWHVSPMYNEDNHGADWTTRTTGTSVVLAHSLTRENIMDAMRKRRTYATLDNTMRISYRVNGEWLGARLKAPERLAVEVKVSTEREEGIGTLLLVAEDNIVVASLEAGLSKSVCWEIELAPDFDYYYLKILNGKLYSVTAPVFVENEPSLVLADLKQGSGEQGELPIAVCATLENKAQTPVTDVAVSFYVTPRSGFELGHLLPYKTVHIGRLEAGETHTVCRDFPHLPPNYRVTAVVQGQLGKRRVADTGFLLASPVIVSAVCPLTSGEGEVENPYPYIQIYNQTASVVDLEGYVLRARHEQGVHRPNSLVRYPLSGITLQPDQTLVIWCKNAKSSLTVSDFNAHYGTALAEGKDLLVTDKLLLLPDTAGHPVDICYGDVTVSRAYYGSYCRIEDPVADQPLLFAASQDMSPCQQRIWAPLSPAPGEILPEQRLSLMNTVLREQEVKEQKKAKERERVVSRLTKKPLVPVQAAALMANAFTSLRHLFSEKE